MLLETYRVALPIILTALMGYIVWLLKEQKKDRDANSEGTKMLLMIKLIEYHDKYVMLGDIPPHAYSNFQKMYQCYMNMGDGNPSIEKMKSEIDEFKKERVRNYGTDHNEHDIVNWNYWGISICGIDHYTSI